MKNNSLFIPLCFLILIFLAGCANSAELQDDISSVVSKTGTKTSTPLAVSPSQTNTPAPSQTAKPSPTFTATLWSTEPDPLQIEVMRQQTYSGSPITIEQTLSRGTGYSRYVVSYLSDGYKIYALMTIPEGTKPETGWPVILFNHGYITPDQYVTTERYVAYIDMVARNGYIVFKSDYRGHGTSEGEPVFGGGYGNPGYTVDILNAIESLKIHEDVDPERFGIWGHSMGGQISLRAMVVSEDINAGVIWGGVVPPYPDIIERWDFLGRGGDLPQSANIQSGAMNWIQSFSGWVQETNDKYGTPEQNPGYWASISPNNYLDELSGPIQLHHSTTDEMVPLAWSETLAEELNLANQDYEFYTYPGDNHNISANFGLAMQRTIAFFDEYVKGE